MSKADAEQLGRRVHRRAKALSPTTSHPTTGTKWGDRLDEGLAPRLSNRTSGYQHKTDIFAGMVRKEKTYVNAVQNQYMTWRMVSDRSDPDAWIHPGIEAHHFFDKTAAELPRLASLVFRGVVAGLQTGGAVGR